MHHQRRASSAAFARQAFGWGVGRGQLTRRAPRTVRLWHLAPTVLIGYLLLVLPLAVASPWWTIPLIGYLGAVAAWALAVPSRAPSRAACVVLLHLCYGAGVLRGLGKGPLTRVAIRVRWHLAPP